MDENGINRPSKRAWKMVKSQGKVRNIEKDIEWQPWLGGHLGFSFQESYIFKSNTIY